MYLSDRAPQARIYGLVINQVISLVHIFLGLRPKKLGRFVRTNTFEVMFSGEILSSSCEKLRD